MELYTINLELVKEALASENSLVVTSLTTLQGAIGDLLRAYVNHTTQVLGGHASSSELAVATSTLLGGALEGDPTLATAVNANVAPGVIKKQKQRRKKDPNAPKAPPTAYFLYAKNARPLIKQDLGPEAKGDAVTFEASRRWNDLPDSEKEGWRNMYKANFAAYKEELNKYNADKAERGEDVLDPEPEVAIDDAVAPDVEEDALQASAAAAADDDDDDTSSDDDDSSSSDDDDEEPAAPPPKPVETPKKAPASRSRPSKANGAAPAAKPKETPVPLPVPQTAAVPEASPAVAKGKADKKRKAGAAAAADVAPAVAPPAEEPKKKKAKKSKGDENIDPSLESAVPSAVVPPSAEAAKKKKRKAA